jgi:hypothetical protein
MIVLRADVVMEPSDLYHPSRLIYPHVTGKAVDSPTVISTIKRKFLRLLLVSAAAGLIVSAITVQHRNCAPAKPRQWDGWDVSITRLAFTTSLKESYGGPKTAAQTLFLSIFV